MVVHSLVQEQRNKLKVSFSLRLTGLKSKPLVLCTMFSCDLSETRRGRSVHRAKEGTPYSSMHRPLLHKSKKVRRTKTLKGPRLGRYNYGYVHQINPPPGPFVSILSSLHSALPSSEIISHTMARLAVVPWTRSRTTQALITESHLVQESH